MATSPSVVANVARDEIAAVRDLLDTMRDPQPVHLLQGERFQDEKVESSLKKIGLLIWHFSAVLQRFYTSHSTYSMSIRQ